MHLTLSHFVVRSVTDGSRAGRTVEVYVSTVMMSGLKVLESRYILTSERTLAGDPLSMPVLRGRIDL